MDPKHLKTVRLILRAIAETRKAGLLATAAMLTEKVERVVVGSHVVQDDEIVGLWHGMSRIASSADYL